MDEITPRGFTEADKVVYNYALDTFRFLYTVLLSVLSLLFTADIALVGLAINQKIPELLWLACIVPIAMLAAAAGVRQHISPFICMAVSIERQYDIRCGMMSTYIASVFGDKAFYKVRDAVAGDGHFAQRVRTANQKTLPEFIAYCSKFLLFALSVHIGFAYALFLHK